ncbi:MAG: N-terminal phage integrase SAM-like domain-containing protein [Trueperaceae bacterium]
MAGQLIRRGDRTWLVRVYAGTVGGKRKYVNRTVHGAKRDAQQALTKMLRDRDQGALAIPTRTTLTEYLNKWKESSLRGRVSPRTFKSYDDNLKRYVLPDLGEKRLTAVEPWDIQRIYQGMRDRGLSASTVRGTHAALRSALKQAVRWQATPRTPWTCPAPAAARTTPSRRNSPAASSTPPPTVNGAPCTTC